MIDEDDVPVEEPVVENVDAVIVVRQTADDGSISTDVITNGDVRLAEVSTLLELGLKAWRHKVGLG